MIKQAQVSTTQTTSLKSLFVAPSQVMRGSIAEAGRVLTRFGERPLVVGGEKTLALVMSQLTPVLEQEGLVPQEAVYTPDCSENSLQALREAVSNHRADFVIGVGGGKALDTAKLLGFQCDLPVVTIPTSAATCAGWTALSNIYSDVGAFQYDVALARCPDLLLLDYDLILTAPKRTLVAGIGDAIAKWYEASVSSGDSSETLIIAAVQQARILRDILFQKSHTALENPGGEDWREVVDASVLLAGVIGGLGGAKCRTVAAHAIHNGLTHLEATHGILHGEKVAYGILAQLRLEEMVQGSKLATSARQQLLQFYKEIGLPKTLEDMGLQDVTLAQLRKVADIACRPESDIHNLPFTVIPEQLVAAMVSTTTAVKVS